MFSVINIVFYCIALLIGVVAFVFFHSYTIFSILIFLIIMPFISYFISYYVFNQLEIKISSTEAVIDKNLEFPFKINIINKTIVPIMELSIKFIVRNSFYNNFQTEEIKVPVNAIKGQLITYPIVSKYSGCIESTIKEIAMWDIMHFYHFKKECSIENLVVVFPDIIKEISVDPDTFISGDDDAEESTTKGSDFSEIKDIREYIPGDSLRDIHWKLSAKKDILMVKEHISLSSNQIVMIIELSNNEDYIVDKILDVAYSLGIDLAQKGYSFNLYWWSEKCGEMRKQLILSVDNMKDCISQILYEQAYIDTRKAKDEFMYTDNSVSNVLWINANEHGKESSIFEFDNQIYVSYLEMEM